MNNEIQQRAKEILEQGAERNKKRFAEINRQEEKQLRDHFAGMAMQGIISSGKSVTPESCAPWAYKVADAMLKSRKEVSGE